MNAPESQGLPPHQAGGAPRVGHVLIVDDNESNQRVASAICGILGLTSECVFSARRAIEAASSGRFDLVLMDICMPEMDGVDAARGIRALGGVAGRVPIIAVTANAEARDRVRYIKAGMCDVVSKPIGLAVLCLAMERALSLDPAGPYADPRPELRKTA